MPHNFTQVWYFYSRIFNIYDRRSAVNLTYDDQAIIDSIKWSFKEATEWIKC